MGLDSRAASALDEQLAFSRSFSDVGWAAFETLKTSVGMTGLHAFPLYPEAMPLAEAVCVHDRLPSSRALSLCIEYMPRTEVDIAPASALLSRGTAFDIDELGLDHLEKTRTYNEFFRPFGIGRQLISFMTFESRPVGFLCLARSREDRAFTSREATVLSDVAHRAKSAIVRLRDEQGYSDLGETLQALDQGLPDACVVFDQYGDTRWWNAMARQRARVREFPYAGGTLELAECTVLARWRDAALQALFGVASAHEGIQAVRVQRPGKPPLAVVVDRTADDTALRALSSRERDVAVMLAEGYSVLNVAARLGLGEGTVRNHVKRIHKKLGVTTRTELLMRLMGRPG